MSRKGRYLVLPALGLQAAVNESSHDFLVALNGPKASLDKVRKGLMATANSLRVSDLATATVTRRARCAPLEEIQVISSINENGVKLVEGAAEVLAALRFTQPGLRVVPEVFYVPARRQVRIRSKVKKLSGTAALQKKLQVTVVRAADGRPVKGVEIIAFTNFADRTGVSGITKSNGKVTLSVNGATKYQRIYAQHEIPGLWSYLGKNIGTSGNLSMELDSVNLSTKDSLRHFHITGGDQDGHGVKVGVIDSGVDLSHPDLTVAGGLGCVPDEPESDFGPTGGSHGTHVAGIIAGRGQAPTGMRGMAPAADVYSYRVFGNTESSGSNFALVKAIQRGVADGCDLLNMSLGFDTDESGVPQIDVAVQEAIREANSNGVVVIAAAGNDGRRPVNYPAFDDLVVAVSAIGRKGTYPSKSSETGDAVSPFGTDKKNFVAAFSNVGVELDASGAGVGVVSTVPGGHAPMSGTSMACPAVTGVLARLLSKSAAILSMPRDAVRADKMKSLLYSHVVSNGFGLQFEGKGLPK